MEGREGVWMDGKREGGQEEGAEGGERVGKGKGRLDFDICPGAPKFLVTPLLTTSLLSCTLSEVLNLPILQCPRLPVTFRSFHFREHS